MPLVGPGGWTTSSAIWALLPAAKSARGWRRAWPCRSAPTPCSGWRAAPALLCSRGRRCGCWRLTNGAWRRGHRYGTVLVDLERNRVVDLLPDRSAESLAAWLKANPSVAVVARDRAGVYADGIRQGAPDAVEVTDRWHLLRNLGDAVHAAVERHHATVRRVALEVMQQPGVPSTPPVAAAAHPGAARRRSVATRERRQGRFDEAARLHAAGASLSAISRQLGADRKTLRHWLRAGVMPSWQKPRRGSVLDPYRDHLERRWAEGCHNAARLWQELKALGFAGRDAVVRRWATSAAGPGRTERRHPGRLMASHGGRPRAGAWHGCWWPSPGPCRGRTVPSPSSCLRRCPNWQPRRQPRSASRAYSARRATRHWRTSSLPRRGRTCPTSSPSCGRTSPLLKPPFACPGRPARPRARSAASK
ncbi:transposase [Paracraurococcus ruber]|nr:transposase [Paracraurococcus ruber]